jgi:hypothetical protein
MVGIGIVTAAAIFVLGLALGAVFLVSLGIRKEERLWLKERARWEEDNRGRVPGEFTPLPPTPITRPAADRSSQAARRIVGLWVRRRYGAGQRETQPWPQHTYPEDDGTLGGHWDLPEDSAL